MKFIVKSFFFSHLLSHASAFPSFDKNKDPNARALQSACPMNQIGAALENANSERDARLALWEAEYPAEEAGRKYSPGFKNPGEVFCDGNDEQYYCDKISGPWADSIPQNGSYCIWTMLEFQDPLEYNLGTAEANTSSWNSLFFAAVESVLQWENATDAVVTFTASAGAANPNSPADPPANPWPTAAIIFKDGNKYAKDWVLNVHRMAFSDVGYNLGFTARMHYKAVECDRVWPTLNANGVPSNATQDETGGLLLNWGQFREFWNAYADMEDLSPQFADACVSECEVAPCPPEVAADSTPTTATAPTEEPQGSAGSVATTMIGMVAVTGLLTLFAL